MRKRAFVFTFSKDLINLTDILIRSIDDSRLHYDIFAIYIPVDDSDTCTWVPPVDNITIETTPMKTSPDNIYCKDNFDERLSETRNPLKNNWIKKISAQWFESRKVLYNKALELMDSGYDQITVTDADFFITDTKELDRVLTTAPDDSITAQFCTVNNRSQLVPDMLANNPDILKLIPERDTYTKMDGECIHTITVKSPEFKEKLRQFYTDQGDMTPGDWMWDMYRQGISLFVTENNCANIIDREHQLSFVFAAISYCIDGITADYEPVDWVTNHTPLFILEQVRAGAATPGSVIRTHHSCADRTEEGWVKFVDQVDELIKRFN